MDFCEAGIFPEALPRLRAAEGADGGAVLDFAGVVRGREKGKPIRGIRYDAHPRMAEVELNKLARAAIGRFDLLGVRLYHRVGFVAAGEVSLLLRVVAAHRPAAYDASRWMVEELKRRVPVWKHPVPIEEAA